ncbi:MAG: ATP-NAD kinase family protein, partial [Promethearchaeota archaeon]
QITARVLQKIKKENIRIICSRSKLATLPEGCIRTDIRDPEMDEALKGYYRVLIDYNEYKMVKMI